MAKTEHETIQLFDEYYNSAYETWSSFYPLAARDLRFYLGDQWEQDERRRLRDEGRNAFVFNRIRRNINMITGYQRKNRLSSIVSPIENSDQLTADQYSQLLLYVMQSQNGYNTISDCFGGALKTGWNLASVYMDFREDPKDGDIRFSREPYSGFIVDPYFSKLDFSDCGYILKRKYLTPDQAGSLLPGRQKDIMSLAENGSGEDDKFPWLPYKQLPNAQDMVAYNEFYMQKWRPVSMIVDMETGEYTEWDGDKSRLKIIKEIYPSLEIVQKPKRYIERHVIVNNQLMLSEENPFGLDEYPFVPFVAIFEPESDDWELKIQSLVRCQIDPQREANRRRSQIVDVLDSQINSGWIADEDSVVNPRSLFQTSQGKVIWRKQDAKPGAIERLQPAQVPPSMFQLQELFDRDMSEILGINDASFGIMESGNESGIMMMLRQSASIINLQDLFDNLRLSQKCLSGKVIKLFQQWSPQKVQRIINSEPSEQFYAMDSSKYDVSVGEGLLTDSQKMIYFRQLVEMKQITDAPSNSPITAQMLIDAAPIQGKSELNQKIAENEKAMQQSQQEQAQVQQQLLDSQRQAMQAKAMSDLALTKERFTRSVANMGLEDERASKSVSDRADAALARIKAIKELQDMDDDRLMKYMGLIRMMEEQSQVQEEEIKQDDVVITQRAEKDRQAQQQETIMQNLMNSMQQQGMQNVQ